MATKHLAAILPQKGGPLTIAERTTPDPGPEEVLVQVKAIALNPIDVYQRDLGFPPIAAYPTVIGWDTAGIVVKLGSDVASSIGGRVNLTVGTRVTAIGTTYYENNSADHGAFQEFFLAKAEGVTPLPENISFEEGAVFPAAVITAMTAWHTLGVSPSNVLRGDKEEEEAILIWGGASSVGSLLIQSARTLGFRVYATASAHNHEYLLNTLGAHAVFDYKSEDVVKGIIAAARKDGVVLNKAHIAAGDGLQAALDVLRETKGDGSAKVAHAPLLPEGHPTLKNTEITFVAPLVDEKERRERMREAFHGWLYEGLKSGGVVPSPRVKVEGGGLEGLNAALDKLKGGVSCAKIVVPI